MGHSPQAQAALRRLEAAQGRLKDFEEGDAPEFYFGDDNSSSDSENGDDGAAVLHT